MNEEQIDKIIFIAALGTFAAICYVMYCQIQERRIKENLQNFIGGAEVGTALKRGLNEYEENRKAEGQEGQSGPEKENNVRSAVGGGKEGSGDDPPAKE